LEKGVLLTLSANSFRLGELAGKKVALVLRGAKPSDIPIETLKTYDLSVNLKTADAIGAKVPAKLLILKGATKVIGE
jgi:putative ABC transport system substrate-binding protein